MIRQSVCIFSSGICVLMVGVLGCSIDSNSDVSEDVSSVLGQAQADAERALVAPAPAAQSSSSSASSSPAASSASSSSSPSSGGAGGFVWKPISEGDGNLVVLLPSTFRGKVTGARIVKGGSTVERGRFSGDTHNGRRPHYRFSQPGAGYGSGLTLVATLRDGSSRSWSIPSGGRRVG